MAEADAPELDEPTRILALAGVMEAAAADPAAEDAQRARAWFNGRLGAFTQALTHDQSGRARTEVERRALAEAARDLIERQVSPPRPEAEAGWPADATLRPGQLLANTFYVRTMLARGGVGEIYRVRHRDLRSEHAVKILRPHHALDPVLVSMLLEEGRHLTANRHPGLLAGQGVIRDADGRLLMLMEFVRGTTLAARLRRGALAPAELATLAAALLHALSALHGSGVVHGDISPDNIMLEGDGVAGAKIIDFGVARRMDAAGEMAALVDFAGKFSWVSPEQLGGGEPVDSRSDLYSLGLILLAAARGKRLELGHDRASAVAARQARLPVDGVPPEWQATMEAMLSPLPDDRPATAADVLARLNGAPARRSWFRRRRRPGAGTRWNALPYQQREGLLGAWRQQR